MPRGGVSASRFAPVRAPARQARPARPAARPVRWIVPIISARAAVRQPPARRPVPAFFPPSVRRASRADRFCVPGPLSYAPSRGDSPACAMMLPPPHVCPPPRPRPAAKTLPYRYTFPTGPGLRAGGKPARAVLPRARRRQGGTPPYFGRFCPFAAPPSGRAHSQKSIAKNGKYSWNVHCNFSQSSPICSIMNHRHSRGPGAHARRAAASGARFPDRLSLCSQVPFPIPGFPFAGNARHPPPGRRRADASFVSFVRPLHAERLRPLAPPGVQHHIGKGECL